jgi:CheY-like chemotaxis protein
MNPSDGSTASIFIATERMVTGELVRKYLKDEFENIQISVDPFSAAAAYDLQHRDVLILAFKSLEEAKHHHLELHRDSLNMQKHAHHTLILCDKSQTQKAYECCRDGTFDDYILFWPTNYDAMRLPLAVHRAMRELSILREDGPSPVEFATQVRDLVGLKVVLDQQMSQGNRQIEAMGQTIAQGTEEIGQAFDSFSQRLVQGGMSDLVAVRNANGLEQAFAELKQVHITGPLHSMAESLEPLRQWSTELKQAGIPHFEAIEAISTLAGRVRQTVMVVDDEKFQFEFVSKMLVEEPYSLVFATGGDEAMKMLRGARPDVLLMDYKMPRMDGIEVIRWMKASSRFSNIPIIMITSHSEESVVEDSLKAGAADFMVKPLSQKGLIAKLREVLAVAKAPSTNHLSDLVKSDVRGS